METGDLVLIESITPCACCVSLWSKSEINHVGMVLRDIIIDDINFDGIYILESGLEAVEMVENNTKNTEKTKNIKILPFGTQIQPLKTIDNQSFNIYYRHIKTERNNEFLNKIKDIYRSIKNASYDLRISVWSELFDTVVLNNKNISTINEAEIQKTFTCSAMIAYILTKLGYSILETVNGNWNMITPRFFNDLNEPWLEPRKLI